MSRLNTAVLKALLPLSLLLPLPAGAGEPRFFASGTGKVATIELFTSEGCSSCPPADAWLSGLKEDPRLWKQIVPMAFHVDYWDYIGWRDRFASQAYSARQRTHKNQGNIRSVYTPGFVVDGREWRGFFRRGKLNLPQTGAGELKVRVRGAEVSAEYAGDLPETLVFNVALLGFGLSNQVTSGENTGRRLQHDFVVLQQESVASDSGSWRLELPAIENNPGETRGIAAWVSRPDSLRPLQATGGWLAN